MNNLSKTISEIFIYFLISFLYYLYKKSKLKKFLKPNPFHTSKIAGSINELTPSPNNLELAKKNIIDETEIGKLVERAYPIDNFYISISEHDFQIYKQPTIFTLLQKLITIISIGETDKLTIPFENLINWYVDPNQKFIALKSFINDTKKDLLIIIYLQGTSLQSFFQEHFPERLSSTAFSEPGTELLEKK